VRRFLVFLLLGAVIGAAAQSAARLAWGPTPVDELMADVMDRDIAATAARDAGDRMGEKIDRAIDELKD
jgi:hypothetical protein